MSSTTQPISRISTTTTRLLAASVAAGYTGFAAYGLAAPLSGYDVMFGIAATTPREEAIVRATARLVFARDASMAAALWALLWMRGCEREAGAVIVAGTILCAVDSAVVWTRKGWQWGLTVAAGAASWTAIGIHLLTRSAAQ